MEACYGGTDVMEMERSCAVARGKDISKYRGGKAQSTGGAQTRV